MLNRATLLFGPPFKHLTQSVFISERPLPRTMDPGTTCSPDKIGAFNRDSVEQFLGVRSTLLDTGPHGYVSRA